MTSKKEADHLFVIQDLMDETLYSPKQTQTGLSAQDPPYNQIVISPKTSTRTTNSEGTF